MLPAVNWEWVFYGGKTGTEPSSIIWYHCQSLSHLTFAFQSCLSLESSLANPLGPAQSLVKLQEVLPNQRDSATCPCGGCEKWLLLAQAQKHRLLPQKRLLLFYTFPLSCLSLPLRAEVGAKEKPRSLRQWEEGSSA